MYVNNVYKYTLLTVDQLKICKFLQLMKVVKNQKRDELLNYDEKKLYILHFFDWCILLTIYTY